MTKKAQNYHADFANPFPNYERLQVANSLMRLPQIYALRVDSRNDKKVHLSLRAQLVARGNPQKEIFRLLITPQYDNKKALKYGKKWLV